jgi:hypothetical protein
MLSQANAVAALERMEQAVAGLSAEDDSRWQIATRLRDLLRRLDGSDEPHHGSFGLPAN